MNTYSDYGYTGADAGLTALVGLAVIGGAFLGLLYYVYFGFAGMALFKKAGHARPWASWVPFYGQWVYLEVGKQQGWWILLPIVGGFVSWIPLLGPIIQFAGSVALFVAMIYAYININKAFQKDVTSWTVFAVLLNPVWLGILAWNKDYYRREQANGPYFLNQQPVMDGATNFQLARSGSTNQGYSQTTSSYPAPGGYSGPQQQNPYGNNHADGQVAPENPYGDSHNSNHVDGTDNPYTDPNQR